jgi:hypothetical protein
MLQFTCGFAAANGPRIHIFNQFIDFTYESGGYSTDPLREIPIEVPTKVNLTVNWDAIPTQGSHIQYFRWMVDGNINDETKRNDEKNDYQYWSRPCRTPWSCGRSWTTVNTGSTWSVATTMARRASASSR